MLPNQPRAHRGRLTMATEKATVDFILDQLAPLPVRARAMFGEYGVYCDEKFVALICDDTLFVKPTAISDRFFTDADLASPYPGAKDHYAAPAALLEDSEQLREVIAGTAELLPLPKKKPAKKATKPSQALTPCPSPVGDRRGGCGAEGVEGVDGVELLRSRGEQHLHVHRCGPHPSAPNDPHPNR
jgi:TfoX/Sxy family transcriptional regulator of competence genes